MSIDPLISVIVPTKNERENIPRLLASIPSHVEVILADASTDGTADHARELRPEQLRVVPGPGTIAHARNRGARAAMGDLLVFTDADVVMDSSYWTFPRSGPAWHGTFGPKLSRDRYIEYYRAVSSAQAAVSEMLGIPVASGSNMIMRRDAFFALGGFRPCLPCSEDTELFFRARRLGYRIEFDRLRVVWATDHRRLDRGRLRKSVHSLSRNFLLYATCTQVRLPRIARHDWMYWNRSERVTG